MVHGKPSGKAYGFVDEFAPGGTLIPSLVPALAISIGAFQLRLD